MSHLADHSASRDAGLVEVVDDGDPADLVPTGEPVDRVTRSLQVDGMFDLGLGQPSLHRV